MATQTKIENMINQDRFSNHYLENILSESNTQQSAKDMGLKNPRILRRFTTDKKYGFVN